MAASLDRLQHEFAITLEWHAFELRPAGSPPSPEIQARIAASRPRLIGRAKAEYGLEIAPGPPGIDSRPALIGEQFAKARGVGPAYHDAVMHAYWQAGRSIDDRVLLTTIAAEVGLDRAEFLAALDSPEERAAMLAEAAEAQAAGITAVPALVFNLTYLVLGAHPYPTLRQVVEQCEAESP